MRASSSRQMPTRMAMMRRTFPMPLVAGNPRPSSSSALPPFRLGWLAATEGSKRTIASAAKKLSSSDCRPNSLTHVATARVASASARITSASSGEAFRWRCAARRLDRPMTSLQSDWRTSSSRSTHDPQSSTQRFNAGAMSSGCVGVLLHMIRLRMPRCLGHSHVARSAMASSKPGTPLTLKFPGWGSAWQQPTASSILPQRGTMTNSSRAANQAAAFCADPRDSSLTTSSTSFNDRPSATAMERTCGPLASSRTAGTLTWRLRSAARSLATWRSPSASSSAAARPR
mmetsp:Transcript_43852/g.130975  ORF Transcript_43852/g.130975 Transcript_43852/m.130975 type:complete len:287 (-) Transcript_43852:658-1518(-)